MKIVVQLLVLALILISQSACKITQAESAARTMNRDLDLARSPYQFKVSESDQTLVRVLRKMPLGETAADPVLRTDIENAISARIGETPKVQEIRVFETHSHLRREVWVVENNGKQLAFDVNMRPGSFGAVNLTLEGPVEVHGSL